MRATARSEERHFWFRGFRWFVRPLIQRALHGITGARILDCGCGTGANLPLEAAFGAAYGFDLSAVGLDGNDVQALAARVVNDFANKQRTTKVWTEAEILDLLEASA